MTGAGVPEAWPLLLTREQLCAYLGGIAESTLRKVCPVAPVDLGANVVRYHRAQVDVWVNGLGPRLREKIAEAQDAPKPANEPGMTPAERARARAEGGRGWRKSGTSSASARAN